MKAYCLTIEEVLKKLDVDLKGLNSSVVQERQKKHGLNELPYKEAPGFVVIFLRQFLSPLIYILLASALISFFLGHTTDSGFITFVLFLNATIGTIQEYNAEKSAQALSKIVPSKSLVIREDELIEINSNELVPGDIVILHSGDKVPADMRLIDSQSLVIDESLLTGESIPVTKDATISLDENTVVGDRSNMAFAGTIVNRGKATAVVTKTGLHTQIGDLAKVLQTPSTKNTSTY
jgi:Ca2+-transporting ATPase